MNKQGKYRGVVVAMDPDDGIMFAKRADSEEQANHIVLDDIFRIMEDYDVPVTLENQRDGYGEWITVCNYNLISGNLCKVEYKLCFDEDDDEGTNGGDEHEAEKPHTAD